MLQLMFLDICLLGCFGEVRRAAEDGVLSLHLLRYLRELERRVEGVDLDFGAVCDLARAKDEEAGVA